MFRHSILAISALGLASAALSLLRPDWATEAGVDVWTLPDLERNLAVQQRRSEEMDTEDRVILDRIAAKEQVIRELLAQRLTLLQAAAWFCHLRTEPPEYPGNRPDYFPGRTESERYCRQVLHWVLIETKNMTPSHAEAIRCRLEAELDAHLASHGGEVVLPEI